MYIYIYIFVYVIHVYIYILYIRMIMNVHPAQTYSQTISQPFYTLAKVCRKMAFP